MKHFLFARARAVFVVVVATMATGAASEQANAQGDTRRLVKHQVATDLVPGGALEYAVSVPTDHVEGQTPYLVVFLHGGGGSADQLGGWLPAIDTAEREGSIARAIWSTPTAGRSFYMNYRDGTQSWETAFMDVYLPALMRKFRISDRNNVVICGISMGGMGSLRLAFKHPDRFGAVAAMEPAIEAALTWQAVAPIDKFYRADQYAVKFGNPEVDADYWRANHPTALAAANPRVLDGLSIYVEVGDVDMLKLHRGAEFLHRVLFDNAVKHEYRLVRGADHIGNAYMAIRFVDLLGFIGRYFDPIEEDARTRATIEQLGRQFPVSDLGAEVPLPAHL